jgi:hypothetical protein
VTGMPTEDRLFFVGTVWSIEYNWSVFGSRLTAFTRGRLYSYLWDLCLLTETLMRRWALNAKEFPDPRVTLCCLLQKAASCIRLKPPDPSLEPLLNASDPPGLVAGLEYLIHGSFQPAERMMRTTYLIRNFAGHHLSFSEPELDASGKPLYDDLFSKYEFALADVLTLLLYLKDQNRI